MCGLQQCSKHSNHGREEPLYSKFDRMIEYEIMIDELQHLILFSMLLKAQKTNRKCGWDIHTLPQARTRQEKFSVHWTYYLMGLVNLKLPILPAGWKNCFWMLCIWGKHTHKFWPIFIGLHEAGGISSLGGCDRKGWTTWGWELNEVILITQPRQWEPISTRWLDHARPLRNEWINTH